MLRHSLTVIVLLFLLGLAMILGYAAWNREAAPDALTEAARLLDEDRAQDALRLLNHVERTLGPNGDPELRRRVFDLRYQAHDRVGNQKNALSDLNNLQRSFGEPSPEDKRTYEYAKIRLLLALGRKEPEQWDRALEEARASLNTNNADHELREIVGQVLQAMYERDLRVIVEEDLPPLLPSEPLERTVAAIDEFVYREPSDPEGRRQLDLLRGLLTDQLRDPQHVDRLLGRLTSIRDRVLETSEHYRFALRGQLPAWNALQGYCGQLLRSDRAQEAGAIAWLYLLRFPRRYGSVIAASRALEAFVAIGNISQACKAGAYWLEKNPVETVVENKWFNYTVLDAYLLYARALHLQKDDIAIDTLNTQLLKHGKANYNNVLWPDMNWNLGLLYDVRKDTNAVESTLAQFCRSYAWREAGPGGEVDWYREALELRYKAARSRNNDAGADLVLEEWIKARPKDRTARFLRAQRLLERGEYLLCVHDTNVIIQAADATAKERETALGIRLEARNREFAKDGRDAAGILKTLVLDDGATIVIPDPVLHIGVARLALDAGLEKIARRQIRAAAESLQWSSTLRLLQARSALLRDEDPLYDIEQVLESDPDSLEAHLLWIEALEKQDASKVRIERAWYDLIRTNPTNLAAAMRLGDLLIERSAFDLALDLGTSAGVNDQGKRELAWIRGRALLGLGRANDAIDELQSLPNESPKRIPALALAMETSARLGKFDKLPGLRRLLLRAQPDARTLTSTAESLASHRRYGEALELLLEVSERNPDLVDGRDGKLFILSGRLRYAQGQTKAGQEDWERAISFPDGSEAIPLLALSFTLEGRIDEAKEILHLTPQPPGDPLILAYLYLRLDRGDDAMAAVRGFRTDRSALLAKLLQQSLHLATKTAGEPPTTPYSWFTTIVNSAPELCFEALALSRGIAFEGHAEEAMKSLAKSLEGSEAFVQSAIETLRSYQNLLAGRDRLAADGLAQVVKTNPDFFPAYDELFLLAEEDRPEMLMTPDMLQRYENLTKKLPAQLVRESKWAILAVIGKGQRSSDPAEAKKIYEQAKVFAETIGSNDPAPLRALARIAQESGDLLTALERQFEVLDKTSGRMQLGELRFTLTLALAALETEEGRSAETALGRLVRKAGDYARLHRDRVSRREADPLGAAAVLQTRLDDIDRTLTDSERHDRAVRLLEATLRPVLEARVPPQRDIEGIVLVLRELADRKPPAEIRSLIEDLLVRDPSMFDLWLLRSELEERYRNVPEARAAVAWIPDVLPDYRPVLDQLVRLRGRYPVSDQAVYEKLLAAIPDDNEGQWARAVLFARLGNATVAEQTFAKVTRPLARPEATLRDLNKIFAGGPTGDFGDVEASFMARAKTDGDAIAAFSDDMATQLDLLVEDRARELEATAVEEERALLRNSTSAPEEEIRRRRDEERIRRAAEQAARRR
ncbi:MAG: hypothetical protein H6832_06780 [Planctomycetes bacterium]|nr:hypothetical protein [Planctomycetota bacterium]MCB9918091.1 hypothetical protein [Planctomycetota bacterium]